jgi:iron complex outermembrane receptor protein
MLWIVNLHAQDNSSNSIDSITEELTASLDEMSLEELMNITITSVSKKPQTLSTAAAAVFVITQEDIKRSGAQVLPEVFRMVPGFNVGRLDGNKWGVSSRGFNGRLSNKLLVLLDGRTLYNSLFSGVFWETQDIPLNDIERIEVIRGPGATLYGSNAVNGVINIITKSAKDTQGTELVVGSGSEERGNGQIRYGGKISDDAFYRFYAKYADRDSQVLADGSDANDDWDMFRTGYRVDYEASEQDTLMITGDLYDGNANTRYPNFSSTPPYSFVTPFENNLWGANILTQWNHTVSETEDWMVQFYFDHNDRESFLFDHVEDVIDLEFQYHIQPFNRHDLIWGLGYRFVGDEVGQTPLISVLPQERDNHIFNAFIQDEIELIEDRLTFILGSKFEHNEYTGFEIQPNARLLWTPHEQHIIWTSVSRAVRTPSRIEQNGRAIANLLPPGNKLFPFPVPVLVSVNGSPNVTSEELLAYELGYRFMPTDWLYFDVTMFYHDYKDVLNGGLGNITSSVFDGVQFLEVPLQFNNKMHGESYGIELAADIQITPKWKIRNAFTTFDMEMHTEASSPIKIFEEVELRNPHFQFSMLSMYDINDKVELDFWARDVSAVDDTLLPFTQNILVDDYIALDLRLGWRPHEDVEIVVGVQNILDNHRPEMGELTINPLRSEIEHSFYITTTWRF